MFIKRGDIFFADLSPVIGSEQDGIRPVLVVQNNSGNKYSPTVIVLPITSKSKQNLPTHIPITNVGLKSDSLILTEQIRTIDKSRLKDKIGEIDRATLAKVKNALKISLSIRMDFKELFYDW